MAPQDHPVHRVGGPLPASAPQREIRKTDRKPASIYGWRNVLDKQPIQITSAVIALANFACIMHWLSITADQRSALNLMLLPVLALFVSSKTTNTAVLHEWTQAVNDADAEGD